MTRDAARAVADALLYEGYLLYPYRASAQKNRNRWQFGVLMPPSYVAADRSESSLMQSECVLECDRDSVVEVTVRFLQVQRRTLHTRHSGAWAEVGALAVGGVTLMPWEEAVEQELVVRSPVGALVDAPHRTSRHVTGGEQTEQVLDDDGRDGVVRRCRRALNAEVTLQATQLDGPWPAVRLRACVANRTTVDSALVAVHLILRIEAGCFVSMVDPPEWAQPGVRDCVNAGLWPVLAGSGGSVMLASPIIMDDHPEIAPESPGDLFDATEIDEILTLRTLTLTDEEKRQARATDPRAAALIERVEAMDGASLQRLHGTIRRLRTSTSSAHDPARAVPWWDPAGEAAVSPGADAVEVGGVPVRRGSVVRLQPGVRRSDAQDMFLVGRLATVEAVLLDLEGQPYLAVTLTDDPAADLHRAHGRYLYFSPDEVEVANR